MATILLVEPDRFMAQLITDSFAVQGLEVATVKDAQGAVDWLDVPKRKCELIILELFLGAHSGVELIHEIRSYADWAKIPVVIHSKADITTLFSEAHLKKEYGVVGVLKKSNKSIPKLVSYANNKVTKR